MGIDILGIDIMGVDILGVDIPAPTHGCLLEAMMEGHHKHIGKTLSL